MEFQFLKRKNLKHKDNKIHIIQYKNPVFLTFFVVAVGVHFETEDVLRDGPMYVLWCLFPVGCKFE